MFNTNLIRAVIQTKLNTINDKVYYINFPKNAEYPYTTFELMQIAELEDGRSDYQLTINIVDRNMENVLEISNDIKAMFDHTEFNDSEMMFHSYLDRENNIILDDKTIHQVQIQFDLYVF